MIGNQNNLYHYSNDLNLSSFITIKNNENNINKKDSAILNQNISFLKDLANILENKLKNNIRLHQKGFEIYRQKLLSDKNLIINNIGNDFRNLSIKKLLEILKQIKEDDNKEMMNNLFNFGKNINKFNDNNIYYNNINMNNENQNSIEMINKMFNDYSNLKNIDLINSDKFKYNFNNMSSDENSKNNLIKYKSQNNGTNNKLGFKNLGYNDPRLIYHSPSPLIIKKQDSKIIEENKNANNQIDFDEPQNL
jgi:hypothetical protein